MGPVFITTVKNRKPERKQNEEVEEKCRQIVDNEIDDMVAEHIEAMKMVIQGEKQQGYIYNDFIVDIIKDYANNRNNYKTFNDYVPVFLDKLKQKVV